MKTALRIIGTILIFAGLLLVWFDSGTYATVEPPPPPWAYAIADFGHQYAGAFMLCGAFAWLLAWLIPNRRPA